MSARDVMWLIIAADCLPAEPEFASLALKPTEEESEPPMFTSALSFVRRRKVLAIGVVVAVAASTVACIGLGAVTQAEDAQTKAAKVQKVIDKNFADPEVIKVGNRYYAYATNNKRNLPVATADKPRGPWKFTGADGMPKLGAWAKPGRTWAPDVSRRPDGSFLLYYTAHHAKSGQQCIGAATASKPEGPFTAVGNAPLVCPTKQGGAIDAGSYSEGGKHWIMYKAENNVIGKPPVIYMHQTGPKGLKLLGKRFAILRNDRAVERGIIEAPVMVKRGGNYILFYAGDHFARNTYFTGYAVAKKITGPFKKADKPLLSMKGLGGAVKGPGGADVVTGPNGVDHIFFHGLVGKARHMYRAELGWVKGRPVLR
ncbi:glycoside hydrolase family 43 protein [Stackebrandtia nassauensis]|uniref:Glycoside hydrolase family 43 n=1 Tax=Stackebrandtia nassauensis (strain DSM 44728 / CIP 108903 / NRRL B-16338 / NBRC 102104 / LLR-40K-21) TaxID=446470 RepID=D3Q7A4_STANL|nr:glycoside hydrolase family 43 protein [Stackebrandtia nassauensis]ADD42375.1 glycoside hydrolase family 43 [Stackebrandtia nassauensis DSM 44728]